MKLSFFVLCLIEDLSLTTTKKNISVMLQKSLQGSNKIHKQYQSSACLETYVHCWRLTSYSPYLLVLKNRRDFQTHSKSLFAPTRAINPARLPSLAHTKSQIINSPSEDIWRPFCLTLKIYTFEAKDLVLKGSSLLDCCKVFFALNLSR